MFIGIGISISNPGKAGEAQPRIRLSNRVIAEDDSIVGTLSVANSPEGVTWTFAITADPDSKFTIENDDELQVADPLDYETATSHQVTIEATPSAGDPIQRTFVITVTNVIEAPVNTVAPAVTGDLDGILTCSTGTWQLPDAAGATFAYQWKDADDDSDLEGETANTLDTQDYIGLEVYCTVTATNSADSTAANSNTVGPLEEFVAPDETAPTIDALSPVDNATGVLIGANLVATFDEDIQFGSSVDIELRLVADDSVIEAWDETDIGSGISISGAALTINPASDLDYETEYYVHIPSGAIEDLSGNPFTGLTGTTWSFTTEEDAAPAFHPSDLFGSGEDGIIWDFTNAASRFQERTGGSATTPADDVDEPIGTILDESGNGNHGTASADGVRPLLKDVGGVLHALFDGSDDKLTNNGFTLFGSPGTVAIACRTPTDQMNMVADSQGGGPILRMSEFGGTIASNEWSGDPAPTFRLNGVAETAGEDVHAAMFGSFAVLVGENLQPDESWMTGVQTPQTGGPMWLVALVIIDRALDGTERSNLEAWLAAKAGL